MTEDEVNGELIKKVRQYGETSRKIVAIRSKLKDMGKRFSELGRVLEMLPEIDMGLGRISLNRFPNGDFIEIERIGSKDADKFPVDDLTPSSLIENVKEFQKNMEERMELARELKAAGLDHVVKGS